MADEKTPNKEPVDYKILSDEEMALSDEELAAATGGVMIYPSQRMRATCGDCGHSFYVLVPLGRKPVVGCPKCRSGRVGLMAI
ncbi:zinc ribbon domain-containing protein [Slackia piriformis]|nr:zinc ribbon domain-containing protein [Slackia piriformis]